MAMNYRTQKNYIKNKLSEIEKISDKGKRLGQYYAFAIELEKTKAQYGGHYMGVGKACSEGMQIARKLSRG